MSSSRGPVGIADTHVSLVDSKVYSVMMAAVGIVQGAVGKEETAVLYRMQLQRRQLRV